MEKNFEDETNNSNRKTNRLNELIFLLNKFIEFIVPYKNLLDTHNVQFLVEEHWSNEKILKKDLRINLETYLNECETKESSIANLIKYFNEFQTSQNENFDNIQTLFLNLKDLKSIWSQQVLTNNKEFLDSDQSNNLEKKIQSIKNQNRFMNKKKTYEVDTMSIFVAKLCQQYKIETIVDIGSGRAYLSTQLSSPLFDSMFNVIAIDSQLDYVESSLKRLNIMKRKTTIFSMSNEEKIDKDSKKVENKFQTFNQFIQSSSELNELIENHLNESSIKNHNFALIGLHSCGNLSNSIVNLYLSNNKNYQYAKKGCKLLCNVACCYNLLNEKYSTDLESNFDPKNTKVEIDSSSKFPMSNYLNVKKYSLTFNLRMLACHSIERILKSLDDYRELNNLNLWYRCILQVILVEKYSDCEIVAKRKNIHQSANIDDDEKSNLKNISVGRKLMKDKEINCDFNDYVRKALEKLSLPKEKISDEEIFQYWQKHFKEKSKFDIYIQLKILISPIIEYIILLDRLVYLYENDTLSNQNHHLVKIFDASVSPRCHALLSFFE